MLERILVPLDGSEFSEQILIQVRRLLLLARAEVVLTWVLSKEELESFGEEMDPTRIASGYLEEHCELLRDEGGTARHEVRIGDPADEILKAARDDRSSLIAMTSHGRSGISRWVRGSVAERVLRQTDVPLLMVTPKHDEEEAEEERLFETILCPLDGSDRGLAILPLVAEMAVLYEAEVVLAYVAPDYPAAIPSGTFPPATISLGPRESKAMLEPARDRLAEKGIDARIVVDEGRPAERILALVDEEKADLLAMTSHGRTGFTRWVMGSIAEKVLRETQVPLLVKRAPHPEDEE